MIDNEKLNETMDEGAVTEFTTGAAPFDRSKKKKKKKVVIQDEPKDSNAAENLEEGQERKDESLQYPDYTYEELLDRIYMLAGGPRRPARVSLKPPQVIAEGTKKTALIDFMDFCSTVHRHPDHVMAYFLAEMGTTGSIDGRQRLLVKGRFTQRYFENIQRKYVNEYVSCNGCRSIDTVFSKESRVTILRCESCGSTRSVGQIKVGFVAAVGHRRNQRT